ncbi:molecular chaperone HtpG [Saccharomonospora sp. CUA-673]|uniref:molecular chaperone HtpG n=1 Tax=Saccharomonospora sp. CUA-673 TaxID=1904969 RepID=UPI0009633D4C|nr:molecular chaperone HtpG [Saccharomonospora sp. CUA-673]OLT47561.1 molecular chaperone HtpG [Saccharomonospora sp. CUA-673]
MTEQVMHESETREFQAEAKQLLRLMVHSIYSDKDVFLRELLSNASDALDKLRLESMVDKELDVDTSDLHIELERDPVARTLTVRDNGIGMSRDDVVGLIGTIARSGTAELLDKLTRAKETQGSELIGQFGVGFYSAFMVADKVTVVTRRAGESTGTRWESEGESTYTVADVDDAPQGTAVTLHLKPVDTDDGMHDYTDTGVLRSIVTRYSDFLAWPIRMEVERVKPAETEDGESETVRESETLNSMKALWARPRSEVTDAEYAEFYKHISHDWADPLETMRLQAEGTFEYQALLFLPSRAPMDLFTRDAKRGVQLYVKRVFIMDDCEELMPEYLRFVKGVVDAQDLSLNVSREILQQDRQIRAMQRRLAKKVLSTVSGLVRSEEQADRDKYRTFWNQFGTCVKEGLVTDPDNHADILAIASFDSTRSADEQTTLAEYVERMPEDQEHIYYLTGRSREMVEKSPHMEAFTSKGVEVLILTDQIDEMWVEAGAEFQGKPFRSIAKGEVDLDSGSADDAADETAKEEFAGLLEWLRTTLSDHVKDVRLSSRLTTSPACLVGDEGDLSPELLRIYKQMGQPLPDIKRILEINPEHALVTGLRESHAKNADDPALGDVAQLLYGTTLLAEGEELPDPHRFAQLLAGRLADGLG